LSSKAILDVVASEVVVCFKCPLSKNRKIAVPGEGNPDAQVMFIGEAPGSQEDLQGCPFVGAAGKFLDVLLSQIGLPRKDAFIGNIVKCRPPRNRAPLPLEIQTCTPYLDRQILAIKPKFIVTLGSHSTAYIFSKAALPFSTITQIHGKLYLTSILGLKINLFPTFHPAAALYSAKYKQQITEDFKQLKKELEREKL
jgi:uracil-DNA glycosylase family 4